MANFAPTVQIEFNDLFVGRLIASGESRDVYEHALDETLVIKVENAARMFCNMSEWEIWHNAPDEFKKWFAPCVAISFSGSILIQKRTRPIAPRMFDTLELPDFMTDLKASNFGWFDDRVVQHDYANHKFFEFGFKRARLKRQPLKQY